MELDAKCVENVKTLYSPNSWEFKKGNTHHFPLVLAEGNHSMIAKIY